MVTLSWSLSIKSLNAATPSAQHPTLESNWQINTLKSTPSLRASAVKKGIAWVGGTGGKIFRSSDQGVHWQDISISGFCGDIRDLEVFDKNTAIAMSVGSGEQSRLYKTENAGKSWQLIYSNKAPEGFFDSIDFWDSTNGLLLGDPVDGFYTLLKTTDGGQTWRRISKAKLPNILNQEAAFAASGNTLITTANNSAWIVTGGLSASAYFSKDLGESWQRFSLPLYAETETAGAYALASNSLGDIFALGGDYKDRSGNYANIAKFNGIQALPHWSAINAGNRGLRTAMTCQSNICFLAGKTGTEISFDHGNQWQVFSNQGFYTIANEGELVVAAGHEGRVAIYKINELDGNNNINSNINSNKPNQTHNE